MSSALENSSFTIGEISASRARTARCFVLLDSRYEIVGAEARLEVLLKGVGLWERPPHRLPAVIERVVRELNVASVEDGAPLAEASLLRYPLLVRSDRLVGPSGKYLAVTLERVSPEDPVNGAAERFRLSPRELQVLTLAMRGFAKRQIAARLMIAESTVGEYFKHLYVKVGVRNRSALFARVFDWPQSGR